MKKAIVLFLVLSMIFIVSCSSKRRVTRVNPDEAIDLSGRWNDTDSNLVSKEMIKDCLSGSWIDKYKAQNKKAPVVIVGRVVNKSHERINVETFVKDLERALINSGEVDFVADKSQREELRSERQDQAMNASDDTQKSPGHEIGADFMVKGQIHTTLDTLGGEQVRAYQVELELIDIKTNRKAWILQKKIKKYIEKADTSW
ncbi:MAG: penicillin-binding protein activator LpoB [Pseudomonadota bacterium]